MTNSESVSRGSRCRNALSSFPISNKYTSVQVSLEKSIASE